MLTHLFIAIGVGVITWLLLYLDSRLFDKPKKRVTYIKVILMTEVIVWSVIYVLTWLSPNSNVKDVLKSSPKIAGNVVNIPEIGEEMLSGEAKF
jgi:hypothetical protein